MWVQKSQGTEKFAVLFPCRPFNGAYREPVLHWVALTDELTVDSDKYHVADIQAEDLGKVGNLGNERLKAVMAMLGKDLEDSVLFYKHYPIDQTEKSQSYAFEAANQIISREDKKTNAITALQEFRLAVVRDK